MFCIQAHMKKIRKYQIAKKAGISAGFFSDILNGNKRPRYATAKRIARATSTSPILWVDGSPENMQRAVLKFSLLKSEQKR